MMVSTTDIAIQPSSDNTTGTASASSARSCLTSGVSDCVWISVFVIGLSVRQAHYFSVATDVIAFEQGRLLSAQCLHKKLDRVVHAQCDAPAADR